MRYRVHEYRILLDYDQFDSKKGNPISDDCRGLILNREDLSSFDPSLPFDEQIVGRTGVLSRPFTRFYNYDDPLSKSVDLDSASFVEKVDGTLINVYWDGYDLSGNDEHAAWKISTRGTLYADVPLTDNPNLTFSVLFKKVLKDTYRISWEEFRSKHLRIGYTYMFELCAMDNRVVVIHKSPKIFLLGIRSTANRNEVDIYSDRASREFSVTRFLPKPTKFPFGDLDSAMNHISSWSPDDHEGLIVVDDKMRRMKIKTDQYWIAFSSMTKKVYTDRSLAMLILMGKTSELDSAQEYLNDDQLAFVSRFKDGLQNFVSKLEESANNYLEMKSILRNDRKTFAATLQKANFSRLENGYIWCRYDNKATDFQSFVNSNVANDSLPTSFVDSMKELILSSNQ